MKNSIISFATSLFCLWLPGCTADIDIDIPEVSPRLVVSSTLLPWPSNGNSKLNSVSVFSSRHIFNDGPLYSVNNATVKIFRNGTFFQELPYWDQDQYRFYPILYPPLQGPMPGETYRVEVSAPGFESVWAETTIPQPVEIAHWQHDRIGLLDEDGTVFSKVSLTFNDPPGQVNYYEIVVSSIGLEHDYTYYKGLLTYEAFITSEPYYPSPIMVNLKSPKRLLFKDDTFNGNECTVSFYYVASQIMQGSTRRLTSGVIVCQLRHVTEEYYKHFATLHQALNQKVEDAFYGMGEPINVFTNVANGLGVFAGYNNSTVFVELDELIIR